MSSISQNEGATVMTLSAFLIGGVIPATWPRAWYCVYAGEHRGRELDPSRKHSGGAWLVCPSMDRRVVPSIRAGLFAATMGTTWTLAIACMAYGMGSFTLPVSVIAPLTNSNALVAVLIGAIAFAEWRNLNLFRVALGTLLICAGATVISLSR